MRTKTLAVITTLAVLALGSLGSTLANSPAYAQRHRHSRWNGSGAMVPAGTSIDVRLDSNISTDNSHQGDTWSGSINQSVYSRGQLVIPAGSPVTGTLMSAVQGTHDTRPQLSLSVRQVTVNGQTQMLNADTEPIVGGSQRAKKLGAIVGGAAAGALLGHTVAKDHHGTLIGGLLGGATGYGLTRNALRTLQLKPGTVLSFTTRQDMMARR